jgi:hypothetical protein
MQLKTIVLQALGNSCTKSSQAVGLEFAVGVDKYQYRAPGSLYPSIASGGNPGMSLSDECQRVNRDPIANVFGSDVAAAVINNDRFEAWPARLFR